MSLTCVSHHIFQTFYWCEVCISARDYSWYDDVIKWKHFSLYWPFVRGIHRSPVNSSHKGQWRGTLMFSLICAYINSWVNNREAGDLGRHRAHYDVILMSTEVAMTAWISHYIPIARNSPVTGEFLSQRPVTRNFDVFFYLRLYKRLSKQSWGWWFETPSWSLWRRCNVNRHVSCDHRKDFPFIVCNQIRGIVLTHCGLVS